MLRFRFNVRVLTTVLYASIFGIAASEVLTSFISYESTRTFRMSLFTQPGTIGPR